MEYFLGFSVDGKWSDWGNYGSCSKTCGAGTRTRTRKCNNPPPLHGGQCPGKDIEYKDCKENECPRMCFQYDILIWGP